MTGTRDADDVTYSVTLLVRSTAEYFHLSGFSYSQEWPLSPEEEIIKLNIEHQVDCSMAKKWVDRMEWQKPCDRPTAEG